jgi:PAS domain S-box-containing protein
LPASLNSPLRWLLAGLLSLGGLLSGAHAAEPVQVFVLHSYSQEYPWTGGQHRGFMESLRSDTARAYDVRVEYLDTKRAAFTPRYAESIAAHLREKYRGYRPAAVYVTDDNAMTFALAHLDALFPDAPLFFSGVNDYAVKPRLDPQRATGVFEKKEIAPNLELMRRIAPDGGEIVVVGDASETYRAIERELRDELRNHGDLRATFISSNRIEDMVGRLRAQKSRFVFLTTLGAVHGRDGRTLTLPETLGAVVGAGQFVVFSMEDAYLYPGVLGGYVTSGRNQGRAAAELLRRHLDGTPLTALPPIEASPNEYVVDDAQLARAGLRLPADVAGQATHLNVAPTFYEANRPVVLGLLYGLVTLLVLGLLAALAVYARKNREILHASRRLVEARDGLDRAQRIAQMGNWDWRLADNRLHWSDGIYRLFGVEPSAFGAGYEAFLDFVHPDDRDTVRDAVRRAIDSAEPYDIEHRIVRPDGEVRFVHESAEVVRDATGKALRMVGTTHDVTERRKAERAVRESAQRLQLFIEHAPASLAMFDRQMRYLAVSRRWRDDFDLDDRIIVGRSHYDVFPDLPERWRAAHARGLAGEVVRADEDRFERPDGSESWQRWEVRPWHGADGTVGGILVFTEDISSFKHATEEIRRLNADLEQRVAVRTAELVAARNEAERLAQAKSQFLANMSHEIRTPLNAVLGLAQIGARDSAGRANEDTFARILDAGEHLLRVVNDILDISRIEAGKLTIEARPFQLPEVVANVRSLLAGAAKQKGLACTVDQAPGMPQWVMGDAHRLQQILVNLLSNAVKFTEHGGVRMRVARDGDDTYFKVIDSGIGMTNAQVARLFKPFEQADSSTTRRYGGSGLGLAISHNLATLMGGEITVDSAPGAGSSLTLRLPLPKAAPAAPRFDRQHRPAQRRLGGVRVLATEDVEVNRLILADLLAHEGAQVVFAEHGEQAVQRIENDGAGAFDIVLMDVQMPVMDGYAATRRIVEIAPRLPVIGVTAHAFAEERQRCRAAGMVGHVSKPIDADELVAAMLTHCRAGGGERPPWAAPGAHVFTAARAQSQPPILDWPALLARFGGSQQFVDKLVRTTIASHREDPAKLRAAIQAQDTGTLGFLAHSLKSVAADLMAPGVQDAAARTEVAARARQGSAFAIAAELADSVDLLLAALANR